MAKVKRTIKQVIKIRVTGPDAASCRELLDRAGKRAMSIANDKAARTLRDAPVEATGNEILRRYESGLDRALQKGLDQETDAFNRSRAGQWGTAVPDSGYPPPLAPLAEDIVNAARAQSKRIDELLDLLLGQGGQLDQFGQPTQYAQLTGPNANATDAGGAAAATDAPHPFKEEDIEANIAPDPGQNHKPGKAVVQFYKLAKQHAEANGVELALVLAIIHEESRGNPREVSENGNGTHYGLMQANRGVAKAVGLNVSNMDEEEFKEFLFVPENAINLGVSYFAKILKDEGLILSELAVLGHRAGPATVRKVIREYAKVIDSPCKDDLGHYRKVAAFILGLPSAEQDKLVKYAVNNTVDSKGVNCAGYANKIRKRIEEYRQLLDKI